MPKKYVQKFFQLDHGVLAGRLRGDCDPRGYQAPKGYWAYAEIISGHPSPLHAGVAFAHAQWWLFLVPHSISQVMAALYRGNITEAEAVEHLCNFPTRQLAEPTRGLLKSGRLPSPVLQPRG